MNSTDAITLSVSLCVEVIAYMIPVVFKFCAQSLILKRIWYSHNSGDINVSHYTKSYVLGPLWLKIMEYCSAIIKEWYSGEYGWQLFGKETMRKKSFVKFIGGNFIHKL